MEQTKKSISPEKMLYVWMGVGIVLAVAFMVTGSIAFVVMLLLHVYIGAALFALAGRLNARHRWRAWVPIANLQLLVNCAGKRWRWFAGILIFPLIYFFLIFLTYQLTGVIEGAPPEMQVAARAQRTLSPFFLLIWLVEILFFITLFSRLAVRCGRPSWWGPLMVLVPPVGLVLLGIMAWSKKPIRCIA